MSINEIHIICLYLINGERKMNRFVEKLIDKQTDRIQTQIDSPIGTIYMQVED